MKARVRRGLLGATAGLMLLAACGGGSGGINEETSQSLKTQVQAIRQSAESFDPAGVESGLAELRASVAQLKSEGELDAERAAEILAAAADVEALVDVVPTTTTAPPPPEDDDDHDDKGKGRDRGGGGDD